MKKLLVIIALCLLPAFVFAAQGTPSAQVTVANTATAMNTAIAGTWLEICNLASNTQAIFCDDNSSVTATSGAPVNPGQCDYKQNYTGSNIFPIWYCITSTSTSVSSWKIR
jgi:hypothetical protein